MRFEIFPASVAKVSGASRFKRHNTRASTIGIE
jgi:hypothetical protein